MAPRLASLLQTNGGLPGDDQEQIKKQLSTRTRRSAGALCLRASTTLRVLRVCAGAQGGALPPEELNSRTGVDCALSGFAPPPTTVQSLTPKTGASLQ